MRAHQFALRAFEGIALAALQPEGFGLLFLSALLQEVVVLAHQQRAMFLVRTATSPVQRTIGALIAPLEAEINFARGLGFQPGTLRAGAVGGADGLALSDVYGELLGGEALADLGRRLRRANQGLDRKSVV